MARGDQLSRQWRIRQSLMAARKGKSATDLSKLLECPSRTDYRDLEALQSAGFPLYAEKSENRTLWSILDGGKHQMPIPLSLTELMALYFSRNMLKALKGSAIHDSLVSLFEKVKATLPSEYVRYLAKWIALISTSSSSSDKDRGQCIPRQDNQHGEFKNNPAQLQFSTINHKS
jgi:predicted DNA-binding transcriptional regulator YafY